MGRPLLMAEIKTKTKELILQELKKQFTNFFNQTTSLNSFSTCYKQDCSFLCFKR